MYHTIQDLILHAPKWLVVLAIAAVVWAFISHLWLTVRIMRYYRDLECVTDEHIKVGLRIKHRLPLK